MPYITIAAAHARPGMIVSEGHDIFPSKPPSEYSHYTWPSPWEVVEIREEGTLLYFKAKWVFDPPGRTFETRCAAKYLWHWVDP